MKSKASLFNWTIFRKDITRFFPVWAIYTALLLVGFDGIVSYGSPAELTEEIAYGITGSLFTVIFFAPLACLLLFGDLYQSRMCNGIHSLPVNRPTLFVTHTIAALCFYILPNALISILRMVITKEYWYISFYWLLGSSLIYICFLGISLLCTFLTGKRFAMVITYALVLYMPMLIALFSELLYPAIPYANNPVRIFLLKLSPTHAISSLDFVRVELLYTGVPKILSVQIIGSDWARLCLWTVVGIVAGAAALPLYLRRPLESAGDFMVEKFMQPIFLAMYMLLICLVFFVLGGKNSILVGLILGYFTGLMLIYRSRHVFTRKAWLGLGIVLVLFVLFNMLTATVSH